MTIPAIPYSDPIRLHQIGAALTRRLEPDVESRSRIARALDLKSLDRFVADIEIVPTVSGWRMSGRVQADAVQSCVLTLEPLSVAINEHFTVNLTETPPDAPADEDGEIDLELDDNSPDGTGDLADELAEAVRTVARGGRVVDPMLATEVVVGGPNPLTEREREVLAVALDGRSAADIAAKVHLSPGTVRNHLSSAIGKTHTANRAAAARARPRSVPAPVLS